MSSHSGGRQGDFSRNKLAQYRVLKYRYDLALARASGDTIRATQLLINLAAVYAQHGIFAPAIDAFQEALDLVRTQPNRRLEAGLICALADLHRATGENHTARQHYSQALVIADELDDRNLRRVCLVGMAKARLAALDRMEAARPRSERFIPRPKPAKPDPPAPVEEAPPPRTVSRSRKAIRPWIGLALFLGLFWLLPVSLSVAGVSDTVSIATVLIASVFGAMMFWLVMRS